MQLTWYVLQENQMQRAIGKAIYNMMSTPLIEDVHVSDRTKPEVQIFSFRACKWKGNISVTM